MSLARKAAGGFLWTTAANLGSRVVTVASTFALTRYLAPEVQGEVNLAYVLVSTAGAATTLGVAQYVAANPKEGRDTTFHGTVLVLALGVLVCVGCIAAAEPVAAWLKAPGMVQYVPGLAAAHYLDRCGWVPRALLVRDMRFRTAGMRVAAGEVAFAVSSVLLAHLGHGGNSIVGGNLVRGVVGLAFLMVVIDRREYLTPCRLALGTMAKLVRFGLPLTIAGLFAMGAMSWDNTFMGYRFGEATVGIYNQAYRLADLPATSVGDQINDVLVPTFARLDDKDARRRGFLRAAGLMALLVFPMTFGLSAVAHSMVEVFYPKSYAGVAPFLAVLASLSVARSLGNLAGALLQVVGRTRSFILIDLILVVTVLGFMAILAPHGPVWSTVGVSVAFLLSLVLTLDALRPEGITLKACAAATFRPLLACLPMVAAVLGARRGLTLAGAPAGARLLAELAAGALVYTAAVWIIAPRLSRDVIDLARTALRRRAAPPAAPSTEAS